MFKNIHIGKLISTRVIECAIETEKICNYFNREEDYVENVYASKSIDAEQLLKWSKLLKYDFFRIYSQHLILHAPPSAVQITSKKSENTLPRFRKNIYTKEIIEYVIEEIESGNMSIKQIMEKYSIPRTTIYKWLNKHKY